MALTVSSSSWLLSGPVYIRY